MGSAWLGAQEAWKAKPVEQPEFANEPPALEEAFHSVTDTDPWARSQAMLAQGMSMQEVLHSPVLLPCHAMRAAVHATSIECIPARRSKPTMYLHP